MTNYEMLFIVKSSNEDEKVSGIANDIKKVVEGEKSKITEFKELGLKKLAYPIKKEINGYYYLIHFTTEKSELEEINRKLRINENVLRHLIIKLDEE